MQHQSSMISYIPNNVTTYSRVPLLERPGKDRPKLYLRSLEERYSPHECQLIESSSSGKDHRLLHTETGY
jgi:hypothetical protein